MWRYFKIVTCVAVDPTYLDGGLAKNQWWKWSGQEGEFIFEAALGVGKGGGLE